VATGTPVATPVITAPALPAPTIPRPTTANPLGDLVSELEGEQERDRGASPTSSSSSNSRARTPTSQRFRQSQTGIGRLAPTSLTSPRRPQAAATPSASTSQILPSVLSSRKTPPPPAEPVETFEVVTEMGKDDWKNALAVEDEQLVDWQAADETITTSDDFTGRKR
jgi:hypothetical protein